MTRFNRPEPEFSADTIIEQLRTISVAAVPDTGAPTAEDAWPRVAAHMANTRTFNSRHDRRGGSQSLRLGLQRAFIGLGAVITLALSTTAIMMWRRGQSADTPTVVREYTTHAAQRASVDLSDGSHVTLAPQSSMRYSTTRNGNRLIELVGQAYFDVTPTDRQSFVVRTGTVETRVLGTSFEVRHYPTDSAVQVIVEHGRVLGQGPRSRIVLSPGMLAQITDSSATTIPVGNVSTLTGWKDGRLAFRDEPVSRVLDVVGRWCGYDIRLADSTLTTRHVTTVLTIGDSRKTMQMLEELLDVRITFDGNVVTLHPLKKSHESKTPRPRGVKPFSIDHEVGK